MATLEYRFPVQDTRSLRQRAVEAIRTSILQGYLKPGDRLVETEIAEQMGTSRGPIREALRELERDGLVISEPYRETVVADITLEEVQELLVPIRRVLEVFAVRQAITRMGDQDLALLDRLVADMRDAGEIGDLHQVVEKDMAFHEAILRLAGHRQASNLWHIVANRIRAHFYRNDSHYPDLRLVADQHRPLLDALHRRDVGRSVEMMEQHLRDAAVITGPNAEDTRSDS
jgi:DNA-binding GntR family transcriptional regulator